MDLKSYLDERKMSANEFTERAHIFTSSVTRFLQGKRRLSPDTAVFISHATKGAVSVEELLFPNGLPTRDTSTDKSKARMAKAK
jgi:DNA-binding transcriptional regulator YdaS (Cro superfamily)